MWRGVLPRQLGGDERGWGAPIIAGGARRLHSRLRRETEEFVWPLLQQRMVAFFEAFSPQAVNTDVHIRCWRRPRGHFKTSLLDQGYLPGYIRGRGGPTRRILVSTKEITPYAFEEEEGHVSFLFYARMFYLQFKNHVERALVSRVLSDPVDKVLYAVNFRRHVPGPIGTLVNVPVTYFGWQESPAFWNRGHVELASPTVPCVLRGERMPPPFRLDLSRAVVVKGNVNTIYLCELADQLPEDRSLVFSPRVDPKAFEVAYVYQRNTLPVVDPPPDSVDPNLLTILGNPAQLSLYGLPPKPHASKHRVAQSKK